MRSRGQKAVINTISSLTLEFVIIICGLILPRLILSKFGSTYNGLTSSINQFLSCAVLLRSGIGGATRAALYKPLQNGDKHAINAIMSATTLFLRKIAFIIAGLIIVFACIYPFLVIDEFDWFFSFSLFIIIGIDTFLQSFFGISNYILLQADQKYYIPAIIHIFTYSLNTVVAVILLNAGFGIHVVKLGSAVVYAIYPFTLAIYVKRVYKLDLSVKPDYAAIQQRWDSFFHQAAAFVMNNTDTIVLTVFCPIETVSVYSVYNMVFAAIRKIIKSFTEGLEAAFGNMIAAGEDRILKKNFQIVEAMIFDVSTFVTVCTGLLVVPFVMVYTKGITDTNYRQLYFAILMAICQFFNSIRQPYQLVVQAAGHYKQTKTGSIIEPIINITISVAMVIKYGLIGVAIGTAVAIAFRTIQYSVYVSQNLIRGSIISMIKNLALSVAECLVICFIYNQLPLNEAQNYGEWVLRAVLASMISFVIVVIGALLFKRESFMLLLRKVRSVFKRSRNSNE